MNKYKILLVEDDKEIMLRKTELKAKGVMELINQFFTLAKLVY